MLKVLKNAMISYTMGQSVLQYHSMILQYSLKHCLSKTAFNDLLALIADLLPRPNNAAHSVYKHQKFFSIFEKQSFIEKHQFCTMCHTILRARVCALMDAIHS